MADLKDEIAQLIAEHGHKAVEDEIKIARPKRKRGRPPEDDAQELKSLAWMDCFYWAFGNDIREDLSDNAHAELYVSFEPEHKQESLKRRIRRKLAGTARLERVLRLMANLDNARCITKRLLHCGNREALAIRLSERAKQELITFEKYDWTKIPDLSPKT